jgi:hypothetical protein
MSSTDPAQTPLQKAIVLIVPAEGFDGVERLRASLMAPGRSVRVLLCVPEGVDPSFAVSIARALEAISVEMQILRHSSIPNLGTTAFELCAPADMLRNDQIEFALALSDVVLKVGKSEPQLEKAARSLDKKVVPLGEALPQLFCAHSITDGLDPRGPGWLASKRSKFGRIEQAMLEVCTFEWIGWDKERRAENAKRLKRCFQGGWKVEPYFAPDEWRQLAPDPATLDESAPIVSRFEAMDRSALYGSYVHRDLIWVTYFLAAFAVLAAVAGALSDAHSWWAFFWGCVEVVALVAVLGLIVASRRFDLRDRWTACRLGAEQLRIARMSLPLLVLPSALATTVTTLAGDSYITKEAEFGSRALEEVKRAVRDQGLPRLTAPLEPSKAAAWIHCIIADQIDYHRRNHAKLDQVETYIGVATGVLFFFALIAVLTHLGTHWRGLLVFTAAGPAFAAALHGAGTRLGIVLRAALSLEMEQTLQQIDSNLVKLMNDPPPAENLEREVRRLAFAAAEAMGSENRSWHGLVRRYRDELP